MGKEASLWFTGMYRDICRVDKVRGEVFRWFCRVDKVRGEAFRWFCRGDKVGGAGFSVALSGWQSEG